MKKSNTISGIKLSKAMPHLKLIEKIYGLRLNRAKEFSIAVNIYKSMLN